MSSAFEPENIAILPGALIEATPKARVLRFPLPPSLPIPLGIAAPDGLLLVTWAFAGLGEDAAEGPICLLALAGDVAPGESLRLATHFRDIAIRPEPTSADALSEAERALLARALLSAGQTGAAALAGFIGLVEASLTALPVAADAPRLAREGEAWTLTGTAIPNGLLWKAAAGWGCARIARARLGFVGGPLVQLGLEPLWGGALGAAPEAAIALHAHGFAPLNPRAA